MRKILMGTLALFAAGQLCGQPGILETRKASDGGRLLTMEETILSPDLKPENREYVWLPEKSYYSFVDDNVLKCGNAKTNAYEDVLSLEDLNSIASSSFSSFPAYSWRGTGNILVADGNRFINIDLEGKRQEYSFELPENASNVAPSPAGDMFAFTDGNNLYLSDIDGNVTAVTADSLRLLYSFHIRQAIPLSVKGKRDLSPQDLDERAIVHHFACSEHFILMSFHTFHQSDMGRKDFTWMLLDRRTGQKTVSKCLTNDLTDTGDKAETHSLFYKDNRTWVRVDDSADDTIRLEILHLR